MGLRCTPEGFCIRHAGVRLCQPPWRFGPASKQAAPKGPGRGATPISSNAVAAQLWLDYLSMWRVQDCGRVPRVVEEKVSISR